MPLRTDVSPLVPEDAANEIITAFTNASAAMRLLRHMPMKRAQKRLPIISTLPAGSAFITADTGLKPLSTAAWSNKYLDAAPIATICIVPEDVEDDAEFDIWGQLKPLVAEDLAIKLDGAIFFGTNKPAVWPTAIGPAAVAAGNTVNTGAGVDIFDDINTAMMAVEADGYDASKAWARQQFKGVIRNIRDTTRGFLYPPAGPSNTGGANVSMGGTVMGLDIAFSKAGLAGFGTGSGNYQMILGDYSQAILGVRKDFRWDYLTEASLYNADGTLNTALAQQDSKALRVVGRFAFQVPNPINRMQGTEANRYPFAAVRQP